MSHITIYTAQACGYCQGAELLLKRKGVGNMTRIEVDRDLGRLAEMTARTGRRTVPQIFIDDFHVGGFDDLAALERSGRLDELLHA